MNSKPTYQCIEMKIIRWAEARRIIPNATPASQLMKAVTEMGELVDAELKNHAPGITDGVGDVMVCLINYCALRDIDLVQCMEWAYDEIKDRKGTLMSNGVFVKEQK